MGGTKVFTTGSWDNPDYLRGYTSAKLHTRFPSHLRLPLSLFPNTTRRTARQWLSHPQVPQLLEVAAVAPLNPSLLDPQEAPQPDRGKLLLPQVLGSQQAAVQACGDFTQKILLVSKLALSQSWS